MSTDVTGYQRDRFERENRARLLAAALHGAAAHEQRAILTELRSLTPHPSCCQHPERCAPARRCDLTTWGGSSCTS